MRSAFIEPEKSLINQINEALCKLDSYKNLFVKNPEIKKNLRVILTNGQQSLEHIQEKYKALQSPEYTEKLTTIWTAITTNTAAFSTQITEMQEILDHFTSQMTLPFDNATREDMLSEFIANISANRDGGASQQAALAQLCGNVALTALESITDLVPNAVLNDTDSISAWLQENRAATRPHIQAALSTEASHLMDINDPDIERMWQNQEAAVNDFITQLLLFEQKTAHACDLEKTIINEWENYRKHSKKINKRKEDDRQTALLEAVSNILEALTHYQKKIKLPISHFGLNLLMDEIQFGQENMFKKFIETQAAFRSLVEKSNQLANTSPPLSPTVSTSGASVSSFSKSSFFSSSFSSASSLSLDTASNDSDLESSDSETDEPPRKCARR